jgi:predicted nucleic acid-binding protein
VVVPSVILAETLYGDQRDARANQALKNLVVLPTTEQMARVAALLKRQSGMRGVKATVDALVVATSIDLGGGAILTSDVGDIDRLAAVFAELRIKAISV